MAANKEALAQGVGDNLDAALLDRLTLDDNAIGQMILGLSQVAGLPAPPPATKLQIFDVVRLSFKLVRCV